MKYSHGPVSHATFTDPIKPCKYKVNTIITMGIQEAKVPVVFEQDKYRRKTFTWTLRSELGSGKTGKKGLGPE